MKHAVIFVCLITEEQEIRSIVNQLITHHELVLQSSWVTLDALNNKQLKTLEHSSHDYKSHNYKKPREQSSHESARNATVILSFDKHHQIIAQLYAQADTDKPSFVKTALDWHKLQKRIVTAGRKSELILQATKLTAESRVLDATAGFGHDSLIMASSGAEVVMIESNPVTALLLLLEQQRMQTEKNWQKLMQRLTIKCADSLDLIRVLTTKQSFDTVYLDPMFPEDSYKGAKVNKNMQVLHTLALPPQKNEEQQLFTIAQQFVNQSGRVVVKRPKNAPHLADIPANESWENDAVRFDGYF